MSANIQLSLRKKKLFGSCVIGVVLNNPLRVTGYFCVHGAWRQDPQDYNNYTVGACLCPDNATGGQCQPGFYCPRGSEKPTSCREGHYCETPGN